MTAVYCIKQPTAANKKVPKNRAAKLPNNSTAPFVPPMANERKMARIVKK